MDTVKSAILLPVAFLAASLVSLSIYGYLEMPNSVMTGAGRGLECTDADPDAPGCIPAGQIQFLSDMRIFLGAVGLAMMVLTPIAIFISDILASREVLSTRVRSGAKAMWLAILWLLPVVGGLAYLFIGRKDFKKA